MQDKSHYEIGLPEDFDIAEVANVPDERNNVIDAGNIEDWKTSEFSEKAKTRPFITGIIVSVWAIGIVMSAIDSLVRGNVLLLIPPALISAPLYMVLRFYYRSG
jgi:hypothetical protein